MRLLASLARRRPRAATGSSLAAFGADTAGVAAVEFAAVLPIMLLLYLGMTEVGQGVATDRKVTLLSRTLADLTSQPASLSRSDVTDVFAAARAVLTPYPSSSAKMIITGVDIDANAAAKVAWSCQSNSTARTKGQTLTLPTGLNVRNTSLIMAEVTMPYTPTIGYVISGTINLSDTTYMRPRQTSSIPDPGC